jgi:3-methyladenine DNA glycosylase AlkD
METQEILAQLKSLGKESIKNVLIKHGAQEPFFGVKVEDLKVIQKKIKKDYILSMELYRTGISDAMYLAGLIADESKMSKEEIQNWADKAYWSMLNEYTVPWVASESKYGYELAMEWIDSDNEKLASCGWSTLASIVSIKPNSELNFNEMNSLLSRVKKEIQSAPNRVRYTMNNFVIAVGSYIPELTEEAISIGSSIGNVTVNLGDTSCKVPFSPDYINKVRAKGTIGKKRKTAKC